MSFYSVPKNHTTPDRLEHAPTGICEKICIEGNKVFDSGQLNTNLCDKTITVNEFDVKPVGEQTLECLEVIHGATTTTDIRICPIEGRKQYCNVVGNIFIPLKCTSKDRCNNIYRGYSSLCIPFEEIFFMPHGGINPVEIKADCNLLVISASNITENSFSCDLCIKTLLKVQSKVLITIPSYGYTKIPLCIDYNDNSCEKFFSSKEFPS